MKASLFSSIAAGALLASLAGCSSKLSEGDVYLAMAKVEQAVQQQDSAAIAQWLAPHAQVVIDMRSADMPEPLRLNKSEYLQLLDTSWSAAGNNYSYERSNTRVEMAPGGKAAMAYATIKEIAALQGEPVTSVSDEVATFALLNGKLQITYVQATVLSVQ